MRCPDCCRPFQILESTIWDYTESALGCPVTGRWPEYTAKVYVDNVELLECGCGPCVNVPHLERLNYHIFGNNQARNIASGNIALDPYSTWIYVGTWDDDNSEWILSQHKEQ